ncbi:MAG TPA: DoxX family protein [Acidimicrobiales bacterium]|nr:DoxX family protein [Acidimicrobiales bacterium]
METLPTADELNAGLLVLRVVVGLVFAFHGYAKFFRGGRIPGTAGWFESLGMRPGHLHARLAATGELATGLCLALGLLTTLAGLGLVGLMAVAFWTVHKGHGLLVFQEGWEYNLVLGAIGVSAATIGPGEWSLDEALGIDLNGTAGFLIALVGGLVLAAALLAAFHRPPAPEPAGSAGATAG